MNAIGLCQHNNMETYCPSCVREKSFNKRVGMGSMIRVGQSAPKYLPPKKLKPVYMSPGRMYAFNGDNDCAAGMNGGMGADCAEGFYRLKILGIDTGQCLPTLSTAANAAQTGVLANVATGVVTSPANVAAAKEAGISAAANKSIAYMKAHPVMIASVVGGIALLALYGTGKLAFGRG